MRLDSSFWQSKLIFRGIRQLLYEKWSKNFEPLCSNVKTLHDNCLDKRRFYYYLVFSEH
jgi:hypothetical protein